MFVLYVLLGLTWFIVTMILAMHIFIENPDWQRDWPWQRKVGLVAFWPLGLPRWIVMMLKEMPKVMMFMGKVESDEDD